MGEHEVGLADQLAHTGKTSLGAKQPKNMAETRARSFFSKAARHSAMRRTIYFAYSARVMPAILHRWIVVGRDPERACQAGMSRIRARRCPLSSVYEPSSRQSTRPSRPTNRA